MGNLLVLALLLGLAACGDDGGGTVDAPAAPDGAGGGSDATPADGADRDAPASGCTEPGACPDGYEVCCEVAGTGVCMVHFDDCPGIPLCDDGPDCPSGGCCPQGFCAEFGCD